MGERKSKIDISNEYGFHVYSIQGHVHRYRKEKAGETVRPRIAEGKDRGFRWDLFPTAEYRRNKKYSEPVVGWVALCCLRGIVSALLLRGEGR